MRKAFLVYGKRTPIGSFLGSLADHQATRLSSIATKAVFKDTGLDPKHVDSVILGNVISAGLGQNPARQASLGADIGVSVPCTNINKVCASGMKSAIYGALEIGAGQSHVVLAGGFESMSNAPHLLKASRKGHKFGDFAAFDALSHDGLVDAYKKVAMGYCGEKTAKDMGISRELQDIYCITSYERAIEATKTGWFKHEITPVEVKGGQVDADEEPSKFIKDRIGKAKPAFADKDGQGTITAGNASKLNDGACSLLLMSEEGLKKTGLTPLAEIISFADAEVDSMDFNICPPIAANKALHHAGLKVSDIDFWEANEAFSVTGIAFMKTMGIKHDQLNVNGGAVALGHPIGMSGARILLSLANTLKHRQGKYGLAAICNGGGGSSAVILRAV